MLYSIFVSFRPRIKKNNKKKRPIEVYKEKSFRIRTEWQFYFILFINIESQSVWFYDLSHDPADISIFIND